MVKTIQVDEALHHRLRLAAVKCGKKLKVFVAELLTTMLDEEEL